MDARILQEYADRIEADLRDNILAFWMDRVVDQERGGFLGAIRNDLTIDPRAERGALLTSRILWTFSAAYRRYRDGAYLAMADHAYRDLMERFHDRAAGGFFWSIQAGGQLARDRKQVYGQAFAIYALTEYHRAKSLASTGTVRLTHPGNPAPDPAPLDAAIATFHLLQRHAFDPRHGGYLEAFDRTWAPIADQRLSAVDLNEPKSQNTHLHVMEAYTNLLRVWPDDVLRRAQTELVELMLQRIVDPRTSHLGLFFAEDWAPRSDRISYGHDIEAAWLFVEAADVLDDGPLKERVRRLAVKIADATLAEGVDLDGGVFNEGGPHGLTNTNKEWWPQTEALVGFLEAHRISGDERHLLAALRAWDFIDAHLIDRRHGEWLRGVTREGAVLADELKVSFWKCPYHNGRAALEATVRLRAIAHGAP